MFSIDFVVDNTHILPAVTVEVCGNHSAGGFGTHLSMKSAADIGLLPRELTDRARILGNAALRGAAMTLADPHTHTRLAQIAADARHVNLGGDSRFSTHYINRMILGEDE